MYDLVTTMGVVFLACVALGVSLLVKTHEPLEADVSAYDPNLGTSYPFQAWPVSVDDEQLNGG
jgi:hypothetical protein